MLKPETVNNFIRQRFHSNSVDYSNLWLYGNCYWFAVILTTRFPSLKIWLFPLENHFAAGNKEGTIFYDWTGSFTLQDRCDIESFTQENSPILWSECKELDPKWSKRIERYCID